MTEYAQNIIRIFNSDIELANAAAETIIEEARISIHFRGRFAICLSGGETPTKLYHILSKHSFRDQIDWKNTFVFWADERCVPSDDSRNNAFMAKTLLLSHVEIPSANIFPIPIALPPEKAAMEYELTIKNFFGKTPPKFDLILLGLGKNGHTASLFPGSHILINSKILVTKTYDVENKMARISMTPYIINQAYRIVFLVTGSPKAEILKKVITGPYEPDKFPAQLIKPMNTKVYWFVDKKASSYLNG